MGILAEPLDFMRTLPLKRGFSVCELGDQWVTAVDPHYLAEAFYRKLGCGNYVSIDGNGRGSVTHDLNLKLPATFGTFDLVTDFGTGEHVFSQLQVWKTIHQLTKVLGFIAFDRPTEGYPGHCYYRVDPCLFEDLAAVNEYRWVHRGERETKRGKLYRGVWQRMSPAKFRAPQQGRYKSILQI